MALPIEQGESIDEWTTMEALGLASSQLRHLSTRGSFSRKDGVSIQFCNFRQENAKHHVLLLTGWDESFLKYGDVISELLAGGFNVYAMDWRSQGLSGRLLLDPQVTYVESFDDHIEDLTFFVNQVVVGSCGVGASELTCLAHSMGGLLSLMAAAGDRGLFQRLVACSPMLRMKAGMPHPVALRLGGLLCRLGLGKWYAPGEGGVDVARPITKKLTTNRERLSAWEKARRAFPIVAMGGMSNRWVVEAIKAQDWFEERAEQVSIPVLLLEADIDTFVCTSKPFSNLCRAARYCRRIRYPTTYHEILFEKDWARSHAMTATITFLKSGEHPTEDELTIIAPPQSPPPPPLRLANLAKRLCFFCQGALGDTTGTDGDGRGSGGEGGGGGGGVGGGGVGGGGGGGDSRVWGLSSLSRPFFSRSKGEKKQEGEQQEQGEGQMGATLACLGLAAAVVGLGAVGVGVVVFAANRPPGGGGGRGGGGSIGGGGGGGARLWRGRS